MNAVPAFASVHDGGAVRQVAETDPQRTGGHGPGCAGEFNVARALGVGEAEIAVPSRILLVDCPLLAFEALALDRAAGVFVPLHVLVSAIGDRTRVSAVNPSALFGARLPIGAAEPVDRMVARVRPAQESALQRSGANSR